MSDTTREPDHVRYRAQVAGVNGWVDGGLFAKRRDAENDAERLTRLYASPTRVVAEDAPGNKTTDNLEDDQGPEEPLSDDADLFDNQNEASLLRQLRLR